MSTPHSTTLQSKSSDLTRSQSALISSHWDEVIRYLVPPGVAWSWGELPISHKVKYNWQWDNLIKRAPDGERWITTEALWLHVIELAGDDEAVGVEGRGQELLPVDTGHHDPRVLADTSPDRPERYRPDRQATLGGDSIPVSDVTTGDEVDHARVNKAKGEVNPSKADLAARDPGQTRLTTVELHDMSKWDVTVHWFRDVNVTAAAADVY